MVDHIEDRVVGPMRILEDEDERSLGSDGREELAERPVCLLRMGTDVAAGDSRGSSLGDRYRARIAGEPRPDPLSHIPAGELTDDLAQRRIRSRFPVRQASAHHNCGVLTGIRDELTCEARLSDSRGASDGAKETRTPLRDIRQHQGKERELPAASDDSRLGHRYAEIAPDFDDAVRGNGLR